MYQHKKISRYQRIIEQITPLISQTTNPIARMSTIIAILHHKMDYFFWTGFYFLYHGKLTVGPYQGSLACLILKNNNGVCWAGINEKKTIIVPDVNNFPGHIACDSRSKSEIVIPVRNYENNIIGVMDIDSKELNSFDSVDAEYLEKIVALIYP